MNRQSVVVAIVSFFVGGALSVVGSAQNAPARAADFQITVDVPKGPSRVVCERGCDWPANPGEGLLTCDQERCRFAFTGYGRVGFGNFDAR
jgi:hypothetical protein